MTLWHNLFSIDEIELQEKKNQTAVHYVCKVLFGNSFAYVFLLQFHVFKASKDYWNIGLSHIWSD